MTTRKAPIEVLERLAEAVDRWSDYRCGFSDATETDGHYLECRRTLAAYRVATAPLRTRASVDAELTGHIRESVTTKAHINDIWERVLRLCSEPIADEPEAESNEYDLASDEILQIVRYWFNYNNLHGIPEYALEQLRALCAKTCVGVER